jgi:hypothetical protein
MFLKEEKFVEHYARTSKLGKQHMYERRRTLLYFRCDNCSEMFTRPKGDVSPKRLSNNYFHCCSQCDSKRFAQKKGIEQKKIWDLPASSLADISKL